MNVAIIGCGLIGQKRAKALVGNRLVTCTDLQQERATTLAGQWPECDVEDHWKHVIARNDVDIVIIAVTHESLAEITLAAISSGKHVLVEKPAARHVDELTPILKAANEGDALIRVGFNHRYHRAFRKAHEIFKSGELGDLMFLRARYGHGGRIGYEKEWRANFDLSGGGELIDQGVHLIDLSRWFLGDFIETKGFAHTYYWDMSVDDNAFLTLKTERDQIAFLHVSCTEWKNLFSFEIYGQKGKLHIEGLGGSYGVERLAYYKMLPQMGPPETTIWEYPMADDSWEIEFSEFIEDIKLQRKPAASLDDAHAVLKVVQNIYKESGYDHHT